MKITIEIKKLRTELFLFLLAFSSVVAPLPCRGLACSNCFACFLVLPLVTVFAFLKKLKKKVDKV